jgi:hypothetical protein
MKSDRDSTVKGVGRGSMSALPTKGARRFAREIAGRHRRARGADTLGFLVSQFGNRFGSANARSLASEKVYKQPGQFFRSTSFKSVTELLMSFNSISQLFMSFDSSRLVQHLRIFLNHVRSGQNFPQSEYARRERVILSATTDRRETLRTISAGFAPPSTSRHLSGAVESRPATLGRRDLLLRLASSRETTPRQVESRTIGRLLTVTRLKRENLERTQLNWSHLTTLQRKIANVLHRTFVRAAGHRESEQKLRWREKQSRGANPERESQTPASALEVMTERSLLLIGQRREQGESVLTPEQGSAARSSRAIAKRTEGMHLVNPVPAMHRVRRIDEKSSMVSSPSSGAIAKRTEGMHLVDPVPTMRWVRRIDQKVSMLSSPLSLSHTTPIRQSTFGTLLPESRSLVERFLQGNRFFGTKLLKHFTARYRAITDDQNPQPASALSMALRAGGMRAASDSFVFAQPRRHEMSVDVVKKIEAREIVEIVRKEVKQSLTKVMSLSSFSRQDYQEISDQVYSSLVRRLTIERERLGLR